MIIDAKTNKLYLADCLPRNYPIFYSNFQKVLDDCRIKTDLIPHTKDIWAVDYMPIQISVGKYIQFVYNPDYLQTERLQKTISNVDLICDTLNLNCLKSDIVLDGGNIVRTTDKVILCDKVFLENPKYNQKQLIEKLEILFEAEKIYFIPQDPNDYIGHADGMLRFINQDTVIINDYSKEKPQFQRAFKIALDNAYLNYIEIPYNPYHNKNYEQANGNYINFLQMENVIILPTFGLKEDEIVVRVFEDLFKDQTIKTIDSNDIANDGGVLNSITWNVMV